jgi:hypothetical protein
LTDYPGHDLSENSSILHDLKTENIANDSKSNLSPVKTYLQDKKSKPTPVTEKQLTFKHLDSAQKGVMPKGSHLRYASYGEINPMMEN